MTKQLKLLEELDAAACALFQIKRMGVSDSVREHASNAHMRACAILDDYLDEVLCPEEREAFYAGSQKRFSEVSGLNTE